MDMNKELKFLCKFEKKNRGGGGGSVGLREVRAHENEKLKFL